MNTGSRVFVVLQGGHVTNVDCGSMTHTVIDFDDAEDKELARRMWASFDDVDRRWLRENYPELMEAYFGDGRMELEDGQEQ